MKGWPADIAALFLRLSAGAVFLPHGSSKVLGDGGPTAFAADMPGDHLPAVLGYVAV